MLKRSVQAGVAIFIAWTLIDVVLHRFVLQPLYAETPALWRPQDELSVPLIYLATFTLIGCFVLMYRFLVRPKSWVAGVRFGALMGLALGVSVGLGTYIHMPVSLAVASGWLIGAFLKAMVAGIIAGFLIKEPGGEHSHIG